MSQTSVSLSFGTPVVRTGRFWNVGGFIHGPWLSHPPDGTRHSASGHRSDSDQESVASTANGTKRDFAAQTGRHSGSAPHTKVSLSHQEIDK